jgi:hypothetical protein
MRRSGPQDDRSIPERRGGGYIGFLIAVKPKR